VLVYSSHTITSCKNCCYSTHSHSTPKFLGAWTEQIRLEDRTREEWSAQWWNAERSTAEKDGEAQQRRPHEAIRPLDYAKGVEQKVVVVQVATAVEVARAAAAAATAIR
jgi:hypothetical protein